MDDLDEVDGVLIREGTSAGADALHQVGPDEEVMAREEADEAREDQEDFFRVQRETLRRLLEFFFAHGCEVPVVYQQVCFVTKMISPEILRRFGKESFAELGKSLGLTRAAMSANFKARIVKVVEVAERRSGRARPSFRANFQKSATACERMAQAQKGNGNRKNGKKGKA